MVDYFSLAITHGLMALALLRMLARSELDRDPPPRPAAEAASAEPAATEPVTADPAPPAGTVPKLAHGRKGPARRA